MATVLFKGGLSGGTEMGGGLSSRLHPPIAFIHLRKLTSSHQCLTCAVSGGSPGQPLAQRDLHTPHEVVHVLRGAVTWLLQQICQCPGEGVKGC